MQHGHCFCGINFREKTTLTDETVILYTFYQCGYFDIRFKVSTQWRFQDLFQGVAEISSEGGENLPGGGENIARYPISLSVFCFSTQHC